MGMHPIREGIADVCAGIFEFMLTPLCKLPEIISSVVIGGSDPIAGTSLDSFLSSMDTYAVTLGNALVPVGSAFSTPVTR